MADGLCVQLKWVSSTVHSKFRPRPSCTSSFVQNPILISDRGTSGLASSRGLLCWRMCKPHSRRKCGLITVSAQWRNSGYNDGDESDSEWKSSWSPRDDYGLYPWDPSWETPDQNDADWIRDDIITLFTTDGLVRIGGSMRPSSEKKQSQIRTFNKKRRYREEDYMDPKQGLCLGAIFDIAATNGLDRGRRICVFGFCRSIEMLNDVVQDTVLDVGGEVVIAEKATTEGLHEKLTMTVAMPLLWGVPPAVDTLHYAIRSGGGIVEKTYKQWHFL